MKVDLDRFTEEIKDFIVFMKGASNISQYQPWSIMLYDQLPKSTTLAVLRDALKALKLDKVANTLPSINTIVGKVYGILDSIAVSDLQQYENECTLHPEIRILFSKYYSYIINHDIPQKDITMFGETILALNKMKNHPNYRSEYKGIWDMFTKQPAHPKRTTGFFVLNNIQKITP
jgi:hypothetical protein